ncbi:MAG: dipicolinate synthase subunit B [Clostridiales bacterium]|nr:dipicolinate synthase subunit B [Clostridiales bacterium]
MIGYAMCGSFCTLSESLGVLEGLSSKYELLPIMSYNASSTDTRFGRAEDFMRRAEEICGRRAVLTIKDAEPLGPKCPLDALIVCPCTGNTLAKISCAVTDTPVTMAVKAHMRNAGTLLIALASNDALAANLSNIGEVLGRKNVYFVPMRQDDVVKKPHSLVADMRLVPDALAAALSGRQLRPLFI